MNAKGTVVFDIIGTCFSLDKPRQRLLELGAPPHALQLWFAQTLRDAFALSHAGSYRSLKEVLEAELPRTLKMLGIEADEEQLERVMNAFSELEPQPSALEAFRILTTAGWKLVALSNGSEDSTRKLLERANALEYFASIYSCDAIQKTKPHPDVYALAKQDASGDVWMVAVHAWDIAGAACAGLRTAFITQEEKDYLGVYPQPDVVASDLVEAANQIVKIDISAVSSPVRARADYDIFISYSRRDKEFVRQLWEALIQANQKTWVDWNDIPPTADWREEIDLGIEAANNFVFVLSPHSISSKVCGEELLHAIDHGKRLVPIVRQGVDSKAVHPELAKLNWIFFREQDDFTSAFDTLIRALETDISYVRSHTRLLVRAKEWENRNRDSSFLLRGSDLESAEEWLGQSSSKTPQPMTLHREYITVSREAETERRETEIRLHRITPQEYRNRQALLSKVKNYWIKGVLENSLHNRMAIELPLEEDLEAVAHPLNLTEETPDQSCKPLPEGTTVIDLFDAMGEGRTLLILGEPGAGKTITVLELASKLVDRAEQDIAQRIPVVLNLSAWGYGKRTVDDWMVKELNIKYQVPKRVGQTWIEKQQLLLVLDGLDEVQDEYQEECIDAINTFHQKHGSEIVVTSRLNDYQALSKRLNFQSAICLSSLTLEQIYHCLDDTNSYPAALRELLLKDEMLSQLARSPLMLSMITLAYQGISREGLSETRSLEERRAELLDAYIAQAFKRRRAAQRYTKAQTIHWLSWLARQMCQFSQTVFLIDGMQPDWLLTKLQRRAYYIGVKMLLASLWGGFHAGLLANHRGGNVIAFGWLDSVQGLGAGLVGGVIYGAIGGLLWERVDDSRNHLYGRLINALLLGGIFGPIFGWIYGEWIYGVTYTLIYGVIGVFIYGFLHSNAAIEPVDIIKWSWRKAVKYSGFGLVIGLLLNFGTSISLIPSLIFGGMLSLILGFENVNEITRETVPNQRIWQSVENSSKLFVTIGLLTGVILGFIENPAFGLLNGVLFGGAAALIGGRATGIVCIKHFILRCILWQRGYIPWNYARFLDYAADCIFLQKVGGGYVFVHRLLQEHFVDMEHDPR